MRVLFDVSHPAHAYFYRYIRQSVLDAGGEALVVARDKDVTLDILRGLGIPHASHGRGGARSKGRQLLELVARDVHLVRIGRQFRPDVVLTRNPSGVQAARVLRVPGIFDTDDGPRVGIHYRAAAPFASVITAPDCLTDDLGAKARKYPSYKALAFLHPDRWRPDPAIRERLRLAVGERYSVLRLAAHSASHDTGHEGLDARARTRLVALLRRFGPVILTSETREAIPDTVTLPVPAHELHHVLAAASVVVGDSGSVIGEAAVLGTPAVAIGDWPGVVHYLHELQIRYGLAAHFRLSQLDDALAYIEEVLEDERSRDLWAERRAKMLTDKVDLTTWYLDLLDEVVSG